MYFRTFLLASASLIAPTSQSSPRAALTIITPSFIVEMLSALIRCLVSGVIGRCSVTKSAFFQAFFISSKIVTKGISSFADCEMKGS